MEEIIMKFMDNVSKEKSNKHLYDNNNSRRFRLWVWTDLKKDVNCYKHEVVYEHSEWKWIT